MSTLTLNDGIQLRGGTAEALSTVNPIPKAREIMIETDTGKTKIGDGSTAWNSLNYAVGGGGLNFGHLSLKTVPQLRGRYHHGLPKRNRFNYTGWER